MVENNKGNVYALVDKICSEYNGDYVHAAFSLLLKMLSNITKNPNEPKFRNFKTTNEAIKSKILIIKENLDLMKETGFVDDNNDGSYVYKDKDTDSVKKTIDIITAAIKQLEEKISNKKAADKNIEAKKLRQEIDEKFRAEAKKKAKVQEQLEYDKLERARRDKAKDSNANQIKFGATDMKCDFKDKNKGG